MVAPEVKQELRALSRELFGRFNRWQKLLKNGLAVVDPTLPSTGNTRIYKMKYFNAESLLTYLKEQKEKRDKALQNK